MDTRNDADQRAAKIAAIRRAIAEGTYETADKLDAAVDALVADLAARSSGESEPAARPRNRPK